MNKKFWTTDKFGNQVLRDLIEEEKSFTWDGYVTGEFDSYNYQYHENFNNFIYDDNGCDYERYGCKIEPNDVVLDIGSNVGIFAHRAETRGASKVICFEPITPTYNCLIKNIGLNTITYKNAVGGSSGVDKFLIHTDFTNTGGGTTLTQDHNSHLSNIVYTEKVFKIDINDIFSLYDKIDFMKIDIEGGEVDVLSSITDENLQSLRCLSAEFHNTYEEFIQFENTFRNRMYNLGFDSFFLYHGTDNLLRTVNFWKK
jgi:FkbM family methyltransferase